MSAPASAGHPVASWATPYVEHLIRAGVLTGLDPLTRPLRRADVARAVALDFAQALQIVEGTYVVVERTERGTFELVPATLVPNDQMWFHYPAMQARVAQAEQDFATGGFTRTETPDDAQALLDSLKRPSHP